MRKKVFLMATLFTIGLTACSNESESMSESTQVDYANETQEIVSENTDNLVIDNVEEEIPTESDDTVQEVSEEDWENLLSQGNIFAEYLSKDDMDLTMDLLMRYYIYHWRELPVDPISEVDQDPLNKIAPLANGLAIAKIPLEAIRWIGSNVFALDHVDYTEERCSDDTSIAVTYYPLDGYYYYKEVDYIGWEDCVATEVVNYGILANGQIYVQVEEVTPYENYSVYLLCKLQNSNDKKYWIFDEISREPLYGNEVFVESTAIQVEQDEVEIPEIYKTIIEDYIAKFPWNSSSFSDSPNASYIYMYYTSLTKVGYMVSDVDNDGVNELLIGDMAYEDTKGKNSMIIDAFTIQEGKAVHFLESGERWSYHLTAEGQFVNEGSGSAFYHGWSKYAINETGELSFIEEVVSDEEYAVQIGLIASLETADSNDYANSYFYNDKEVLGYEYYKHISQENAEEIIADYEDSYVDIHYTPFSEYKK